MSFERLAATVRRIAPLVPVTEREAYDFGFDAGKNGVNATNTHFRIFSGPANTRAWERGKQKAEILRQAQDDNPGGRR